MDPTTIRGQVIKKIKEGDVELEISKPLNMYRCVKCSNVYFDIGVAENCCKGGKKILVEVE